MANFTGAAEPLTHDGFVSIITDLGLDPANLGHSSFKRPRGRRVTGLRRSEALGFGDHDVAQCCFGRPLSVPRFPGDHVLRVDPDLDGAALTRRATPPRLRSCVAA